MLNSYDFNFDISDYEIYEYDLFKSLIAITKQNQKRLDTFEVKYGKYENVPDEEVIEAIILQLNKYEGKYSMDKSVKRNVLINQLKNIWIQTK